jgi:hypothetical protein
MRAHGALLLGLLVLGLSGTSPLAWGADSIAGVCPDGSAFVVHQRADIPCSRAKLVEPSEIPPLRPDLLPRPYPWMVDQQARNPDNPYNLLEAAEAVRRLHQGEKPGSEPEPSLRPEAPRAPVSTQQGGLSLPPDEVQALLELVDLRQDLAPATLRSEDALGRGRMEVQFAYSRALERRVSRWLGGDPAVHVLLFSVRALEAGEFYPGLFFVQDAEVFRPDPSTLQEVGFLIGSPGPMDPGAVRLGYVVLPGRFSPERPMELWWNDRRLEATLEP